MRYYGVKISTGNGHCRFLAGWDSTFSTRAEAEECARRANAHDGWTARVVSIPAKDAARFGWSAPAAKGGAR